MKKTLTLSAGLLAAFAATQASAITYQHIAHTDRNGVKDATFTYQDTSDLFSLSFETHTNDAVDGFWFVVNDGPQPYHEGQGHLAIFYSDLTDVWAYQYTGSGVSGVNASYNSTVIEKFDNAVSTSISGDTTAFSMLLDLTAVNSANLTTDWLGLAFDEKIGTWLHPTINSFANCGGSYQSGDELTCFSGNNWKGWDEANRTAQVVPDSEISPVPLPAGLPLLAGALGVLAIGRRRKTA